LIGRRSRRPGVAAEYAQYQLRAEMRYQWRGEDSVVEVWKEANNAVGRAPPPGA